MPHDRRVAATSIALLLAACGRSSEPNATPPDVVVVTAATATPPHTSDAPSPSPSAAAAPAAPRSLGEMRPRKTFIDPPLPPELRDDGDLNPLPPSGDRREDQR